MTNNSTKRALISSAIALCLCFVMLVGTTFAWFTDEVTSANNIIQTGTLDVGLSFKSPTDTEWTNISDANEPIFKNDKWEPGYTDVKYVKITNDGTLAFKYQLNIVPNVISTDAEYNLADVIDVYLFAPDATIDRDAIAAATPVGTLSDLMAENDGAAHGILLPADGKGSDNVNADESAGTPSGEISYCIVLKMQESAGNEYQGLSVGEGFAIQLLATQYTWENDSFDHLYDEDADYNTAPKADVQVTSGKWIETTDGTIWANTTLQFQPNDTEEEGAVSPYALYHADFVVYADEDIPANSVILPGYYSAYCDAVTDGKWLGLTSNSDISAGTEIRLVEFLGATVNYAEICKWGNDNTGFLCGVSAVADENGNYIAAGTTITVELRLYEVPAKGECANGGGCKHPTTDCETGNYIVIGTYKYTIPETIADRT